MRPLRLVRLGVCLALFTLLVGCTDGSNNDATAPGSRDSIPGSPSEANESRHWTTIDPESPGELEAGRYALPAIGSRNGPLAVVTLPDGYQS